jgi:DnaJ-class molecular chaperone
VLALTYHPDKNPERMAQVNFKFCQICEAFEVLSTPELRDAYDRYGEKVLKKGIPGGQQAYRFSGDAFEIFENFFGTANPHNIALDNEGKQIQLFEKIENDIHKDAVTQRDLTHAADLCIECECTLEEFYFGSTKTVKFEREFKTGPDSAEVVTAERSIEIKPGMAQGTKLTFPKEGHQPSNKLVGDLIVSLKETCHSKYRRCGDDIVYMHQMSLADALTTAPFEFTTLEGELFKITPDVIVNPEST